MSLVRPYTSYVLHPCPFRLNNVAFVWPSAFVLNCARFGMWVPGNADARLEIAREIVHIGETLGDTFLQYSGWGWLVCDLWELGNADGAREGIDKLAELDTALRMAETAWVVTVYNGCLALFEGRLADAERFMDEGLAHGQRAQSTTAVQFYGVQLFALRRLTGGLEDLVPMFTAMVDEYPLIPAWRCGLVYLYAELDWLDKAREQFRVLAATDFELPFDANWAVGMAILGFAAATLQETDAARLLYERMAPYADAVITVGMPADVIGPLHLPLAQVAAAAGDWDAFERHRDAATKWFVATGGAAWLAVAKYHFATALLRGEREGVSEDVRSLLEEAAAASREFGFSRVEERARLLLSQN